MAASPQHSSAKYDTGDDDLPASNVVWSDGPVARDHPFTTAERERYSDPQEMARGGMGRVSVVVDQRLLREVALKEVQPGDGDVGLEQRLAQEAWITAQLEHPGIVPVYDAGKTNQGRLFFTMRLIRGRSLASALAKRTLDDATLLRHFLAVCQAMSYAHARGVVHRDLKPANIMIGAFGETHVVDWGVAFVLAASGPNDAGHGPRIVPDALGAHTVVGTRVGTPAYMSPEQAMAKPVGRASDVWSLGLILYEIVARRVFFDGMTTIEIFTRLEQGHLPAIDVSVAPPELVAIIVRALEPDPARRYPDARHLADDIAAYIDGRRVHAYDYSAWDMAKRFGRAFRVPLIVAGLALVTIAVVFALSYSQTLEERDRAQAAEASAEASRDRAVSSEAVATRSLAEADRSFATLLVARAREAQRHGAQAEAELLAAHALTRGESPEARGVLARYAAGARVVLLQDDVAPSCEGAALAPDGAHLLCVEADATSLWSVTPLQLRWQVARRFDQVAFLSASHVLVAERPWQASTLVDVETGAMLPFGQPLVAPRLKAAAGTVLADDGADGLVVWRDATHTTTKITAPQGEPWAVSGDGRVAVAIDADASRPMRIDLETLRLTSMVMVPFTEPGLISAALDREGRRVAFGATRGELVVMAVADGAVLTRQQVTERALTQLMWSPDDRWLAVRDERGWVSLLDMTTATRLALPRTKVSHLAWRVDAAGLALVTYGEQLTVYAVPTTPTANVYRTPTGIAALALDVDAEVVALPEGSGDVGLYDVGSGARVGIVQGDGHAVAKHAAFMFGDGGVAVTWPQRLLLAVARPASDGMQIEAQGPAVNYKRVVATADGELYAAGYGRTVWRFVKGQERQGFVLRDGGSPLDLVASRDGQVVAWLSSRGGVELARGASVVAPMSLAGAIRIALSGDGVVLAVASADAVHVLAGETRVVVVPGARICEVALSADGAWVAAGTIDGEVWVWDGTGELRMVGVGHDQRVSGVAFGDGWVMSAGWDGVALRWDLGGLGRAPVSLVHEFERAWGRGLEHAVRADTR